MDMAVHEAVIAAKKEKSGCTIHFVTEVSLELVFNKVMEGDLQHPEGFALRKLVLYRFYISRSDRVYLLLTVFWEMCTLHQ
jgi:hypothetical protein